MIVIAKRVFSDGGGWLVGVLFRLRKGVGGGALRLESF